MRSSRPTHCQTVGLPKIVSFEPLVPSAEWDCPWDLLDLHRYVNVQERDTLPREWSDLASDCHVVVLLDFRVSHGAEKMPWMRMNPDD